MIIHHQEFSPQKLLEEHILSFPPIKDFITFYGKRPKMVTHSQFSIFHYFDYSVIETKPSWRGFAGVSFSM